MDPLRLPGAWRASLQSLVLLAVLLAAGAAQALSIGNASLHSRVGEPLRVTIPLGHLGSLGEHEIAVGRAPDSDYAKFGIDPAAYAGPLKFTLSVDERGDASVQVSTDEPFNEPFVDMVIEVRWPAGRLVKQFTLLLDLPPR